MSEYKRLTKRGGVEKIVDFAEERGYSTIYQRLSVLEDMLESGELVEFPRKEATRYYNGDADFRVVYIEGRAVTTKYFQTEAQADEFIEMIRKGMRRRTSNE